MVIVARYPRDAQPIDPSADASMADLLTVYDELREMYDTAEIAVIAKNSWFFAQYKVVEDEGDVIRAC